MLGGEIARGLVAGQMNDGGSIRVGGKNRLGLRPHSQVELPARERKERDVPASQFLLQVLPDKTRPARNQYLSLGHN